MGWTHHRARVAVLSRDRQPDDPELLDERRTLRAIKLEESIRRALACEPPLSDTQRRRLARLIAGGTDDDSDVIESDGTRQPSVGEPGSERPNDARARTDALPPAFGACDQRVTTGAVTCSDTPSSGYAIRRSDEGALTEDQDSHADGLLPATATSSASTHPTGAHGAQRRSEPHDGPVYAQDGDA